MTIRTIINNHISFGNWEGRVKKVYKTKGTGRECVATWEKCLSVKMGFLISRSIPPFTRIRNYIKFRDHRIVRNSLLLNTLTRS